MIQYLILRKTLLASLIIVKKMLKDSKAEHNNFLKALSFKNDPKMFKFQHQYQSWYRKAIKQS